MPKKTGFKPLPTSLKILFILTAITLVNAIYSLMTGAVTFTPFFGFLISGTLAVTITAVVGLVAPALILYSFWERESWGWETTLALLGLGIINTALLFTNLEAFIALTMQNLPPEALVQADTIEPMMKLFTVIGSAVNIAVYGLFCWLVTNQKKYFKQP